MALVYILMQQLSHVLVLLLKTPSWIVRQLMHHHVDVILHWMVSWH